MKINHYGFATKDLLRSTESYFKLGYRVTSDIYTDNIQQVKIVFLKKDHEVEIELVEPLNQNSPVANILNKKGNSLYHTCFEVDNIYASIQKLKAEKFVLIKEPVQAVALQNNLICFMYHIHVGLIELTQR